MRMSFHPVKSSFLRPQADASRARSVALVVIVLIVYLVGAALFGFIDRHFPLLVYPVYKAGEGLRAAGSGLLGVLQPAQALVRENTDLKQKNSELSLALLAKSEVEKENSELRNLAITVPAAKNLVRAKVIAKPDFLPYDLVVIDVGSERLPKLKIGQLVFLSSEVVIGQVVYVSPTYAKVRLFSSAGNQVPVVIGAKNLPAVAAGLGSGNFSLSLPRGVDIRVGDTIKTTLIGSYLLGTVAQIEKQPNDPFQQLIAKTPLNLYELSWVLLSATP